MKFVPVMKQINRKGSENENMDLGKMQGKKKQLVAQRGARW